MAFKKPTVKRSATDISKITGFIMGVRKFGKTTLWADMINEKFGDPEMGLLVSCGMEHGTNMIDNINTTHINTYKEMDELKKWLISERGRSTKFKWFVLTVPKNFLAFLSRKQLDDLTLRIKKLLNLLRQHMVVTQMEKKNVQKS